MFALIVPKLLIIIGPPIVVNMFRDYLDITRSLRVISYILKSILSSSTPHVGYLDLVYYPSLHVSVCVCVNFITLCVLIINLVVVWPNKFK